MVSLSPHPDTGPLSAERKKPVASLLPAFEPLSSSPILPKSLKRSRGVFEEQSHLPTPVPTSSTHILSSSPPKSQVRPASNHSERVPLGAVPTVIIRADGLPTKLGRSSQTCDYQLSANRLISRVHVEVTYFPPTSRLQREKLEILCIGWNGVKIHCQSKVFDLRRGQIFSSNSRLSDIMLDIHDSRVMLQWPEKPLLGLASSDEEDLDASPSKKQRHMRRHSTPPSPSPVQTRKARPASPTSPTPAVLSLLPSSPPILPSLEQPPKVDIFEDPESDGLEPPVTNIQGPLTTKSIAQDAHDENQMPESSPSDLSDPQSFSDHDEENDPIIHSFGPFGANLLPRMAAVTAGASPRIASPSKGRLSAPEPLRSLPSPSASSSHNIDPDVQSHVINQLAFSRLSSLPLSTIMSNLPTDAQTVSARHLKQMIHDTPCIGEVTREGKDAAGKPLENEFYYIPDNDDDVNRQQAVVKDLRKPGLRACRKQHKQYYWKKPK